MTTSDSCYDKAKAILAQHPDWLNEAEPQPDEIIDEAERALGLRFPPTYRRFLQELGTAIFAGEEVYGICGRNIKGASVPNVVWVTLHRRQQMGLPHNNIVLYAVGNGEFMCLEITGDEDDECPVVSFLPGGKPGVFRSAVEAPNFGAWWLALVQQAVTDMEIIEAEEDSDDE